MSGKKKNAYGSQWAGVLIYALVGAVCGFLMLDWFFYLDGSFLPTVLLYVLFFLGLALAMVIHTVIHEAGHLIFGLATGYRFISYRVFQFMWIKQGNRIRFTRMSVAGTGGQCLLAPPELKDGKIPFLLSNLGGALMNLLTGLTFLAGGLLCPPWTFGRTFLLLLAVFGFAFALMNGLPMSSGPVPNDGRNILDMLRHPEAVRALWLQLKINELTSQGVRVREMPAEWFGMPAPEQMTCSLITTVAVLCCDRLKDEHRFAEADREMARLLADTPHLAGLHRALLTCDRTFIELITENRPEALAELRTKDQQRMTAAMKTSPTVLRTEYAYALLQEKDEKKATQLKQQFDKLAAVYPYPTEIEAERELIKMAEDLCTDPKS